MRPGTTAIHSFSVNLDRSPAVERVIVYDVPSTGDTCVTVWKQRSAGWHREQELDFRRAGGSGLQNAWLGDINLDKRRELVVKVTETPAVGEVVRIFDAHTLHVALLQIIGGDTVQVHAATATRPMTFTVTIGAARSHDGASHTGLWQWSSSARRWTCTSGPGCEPYHRLP